jgi:phosphoribosylamine-glycine ligase
VRIALIDPEGCLVCFPRRMLDEGADVMYYVHPNEASTVGDNLVPKTSSMHQLLWWCKQEPSIAFFLGSGMGKGVHTGAPDKRVPVGADDFRKAGVLVVGGGSFCDRLEHDRLFGEEIAREIGCKLPKTFAFETVSEAIKHVTEHDEDGWFFKSDKYLSADATCGGTGEPLIRNLERIRKNHGDRIPNIVQEKIEGVALSTACWWNGMTFVRPFEGTIEYKKAYNGNLGPGTGCAANVVWMYRQDAPRIVAQQGWDKLGKIFFSNNAPPGIYDINAIATESGETYFLEWTPRLGIDSEPTSFRLWNGSSAEILTRLARGTLAEIPVTGQLGYSVRLGVPPYPFEGYDKDKGSAMGAPIIGEDGHWDGNFISYAVRANADGKLEVGDRLGLVGLSLQTGTKLSVLHDKALDYAKTLEIQGLGYRTDALTYMKKDAASLRKGGFEVPGGLLE